MEYAIYACKILRDRIFSQLGLSFLFGNEIMLHNEYYWSQYRLLSE
jgi:hypothetical protein